MTDQPTPKPLTAEEEAAIREEAKEYMRPFCQRSMARMIATLDASRAECAALRATMTDQQMTKEVCPHCDRAVYQIPTPAEADRAMAEAGEIPMSEQEVQGIVAATTRGNREPVPNDASIESLRNFLMARSDNASDNIKLPCGRAIGIIKSLDESLAHISADLARAVVPDTLEAMVRQVITDRADLLKQRDSLRESLAAAEKSRDALAAELAEVRKVLDRLPKTADGVLVNSLDVLWQSHPEVGEPIMHREYIVDQVGAFVTFQKAQYLVSVHCYSTREAALAARDSGKGGTDAKPE